MPAHAVRIYPIETTGDEKALAQWRHRRLMYEGSAGSDAVWRYEPSYWELGPLMTSDRLTDPGAWYTDYAFELDKDALRALDARMRSHALDWQRNDQFPEMDRALAPDSPFTRFRIVIYEWESGLPS